MESGQILNDKNKLITKDIINGILGKFGIDHRVNKMTDFVHSTTHESYCASSYGNMLIFHEHDTIQLQIESYERLEFLGDSVIHCVIAEYLFKRYPQQREGFMTKLRTKLENGEMLSKFTKILGLDNYILLSRDWEVGRSNTDIMEDVFESFIGALYLDGNMLPCKELIVNLLEKYVDISELIYRDVNYKDILMQYSQQKKWRDPVYGVNRVIDENDANCATNATHATHKKYYEMYVKINNEIVGIGIGPSKKCGQKDAAKNALKKLGYVNDFERHLEDEKYVRI